MTEIVPPDCSDEPKLTVEEWDYVGQLEDEPGKHAAREGD